MPEFLGDSDIYLFTSHFEGCPNALLEAMMAACVPVSGIIDGITDFLIEEGRTGYLCKLGDADGFADAIATLQADRDRLAAMSRDVGAEARARYSNETAAQSYAGLLRDVMTAPAPSVTPRAWSDFQPDPNFPGYWRHWIPAGVKQVLRKALRR